MSQKLFSTGPGTFRRAKRATTDTTDWFVTLYWTSCDSLFGVTSHTATYLFIGVKHINKTNNTP